MLEDADRSTLWDQAHTLLESRHEDASLPLFERLGGLGDWRGYYMVGWIHESRGMRAQAHWVRRRTQRGAADADADPGARHRQQYITAAHWFERALVLQNNTASRMGLARHHFFGLGGVPDFHAAFEHLVYAQFDRDPVAQIMLAELLYRGRGTSRDVVRARLLLRAAAAAGYPGARVSLMHLAWQQRHYLEAASQGLRAGAQILRMVWRNPSDPRLIGVGGRYGSFARAASGTSR